ncbi:ABC transporter permease [Aquitalea aquatica]|uniref:ABC transporter permease n=1 Tax=Aquitalea aquatica TaxID=3044273 RepID=A0A838Y6I5_9NEIS|nr:ABC transporter permease [Aquitalea magnusonii]MBA4708157.1 ABC transporter permease [Aquitalea magnusonii]
MFSNAIEDIKDAYHSRHLWLALGWQDIRLRYRRSKIGPFWITISMAITIAAMGPLYGMLFKNDLNTFIPRLTLGLILWGYMSGMMNDFSDSFAGSAHYIRQMKLPMSLFIFRIMWRHTIIMAHNLVIFVIELFLLPIQLNWHDLLFIPGIVLVAANLFWIGVLAGIFCTRFRDMQPIVSNLISLLFFVTPILWNVDQLSPTKQHLIYLNPFTGFLEITRQPLLGQFPAPWIWGFAIATLVVGTIIALALFSRYKHRIAYWI